MIIFLITLSIFQVQAQTLYNGVGHVPAAYQETWNEAGLLRDMSSVEPKLVIVITPGDASSQVTTAITQARNHVNSTGGLAIIYFGEGTFDFTSSITLTSNDSNIVFQGEGSDKTTINFQNMKNSQCFFITGTAGSWSDLDHDINKGESVLHAPAGGLSAISVGDWVHFVKYRFDYGVPPEDLIPDIVGQITQLQAKGTDATGEWGEIKDEANMDYEDSGNTNYSLKIRRINPVRNIGIEDLKIIRTPNEKASSSFYAYNIYLNFAINCWVRGVDSYKPSRNHLSVSRSSHIEISGCYFHEAMDYGGGGWGYGVVIGESSTNCLVENNIFRKLRHALVATSGSNCNVWAFNYSREQYSTYWLGIGYDDRDLDLHAKYPFGHLFEHNIVERIASDDYHGDNGPFNTFVRNMATEDISIFKTMEQWSILGNMEGLDNLLYPLRYNCDFSPATDIYGFLDNYTLPVSHNVAYDFGAYSSYRLADISYYYSSKPPFLASSYTWPAIGPQTSSTQLTQNIPARSRYNNYKKTYLPNPTPKPLTYSGTMPYSQSWSGTHTLTGSVTVPIGVTLTVEPGAIIRVPPGNKITINGNLIGDYATFTSISGTWYGIEFNHAQSGSSIRNCTIKNAQVGVHLIDTNVYLGSNVIQSNFIGLLFNSGSDGNVIGNEIVSNEDYGIKCTNYSDPLIFSSNIIRDNGYDYGDYGIYGDGSSAFDLGRYSDQGHNSIYDNFLYEVYSEYPGTIYARYNWWGDSNPSPFVSSNVDWSDYLTFDPNGLMAKRRIDLVDSNLQLTKTVTSADTVGMTEVDYAYLIYRRGDYQTAANLFEAILHKYPTHFSGRRALAFLCRANEHLNKSSENLSLLDNISAAYTNEEIDALAKNIAFDLLIKQSKYREAISKSRAVINSFAETAYFKQALFDLGSIYWYCLNDRKTGEIFYRQLIDSFPDDDLTISAMATLDEWEPKKQNLKHQPLHKNRTKQGQLKLSLKQNCPNPFNLETTIRFNLPETAFLTLKIFDISGREIRQLVSQRVSSGEHQVIWDGKSNSGQEVSSGIYIYEIRTKKFVQSRKMIMVK